MTPKRKIEILETALVMFEINTDYDFLCHAIYATDINSAEHAEIIDHIHKTWPLKKFNILKSASFLFPPTAEYRPARIEFLTNHIAELKAQLQ